MILDLRDEICKRKLDISLPKKNKKKREREEKKKETYHDIRKGSSSWLNTLMMRLSLVTE